MYFFTLIVIKSHNLWIFMNNKVLKSKYLIFGINASTQNTSFFDIKSACLYESTDCYDYLMLFYTCIYKKNEICLIVWK